ncbi:MAG TPA: phosphate ABC transporter permease PstA [Planctomycetota bacterium]|nr:phosphate ABC transporter permease PstA [Planctomycetota bacterium]
MSRKSATQFIAFWLLRLVCYTVVAATGYIILDIAAKGWPHLSWEFLTAMPRNRMSAGGIWPAIVGTLYLVLLTIALAFPLGVGAAIYLGEYARAGRLTRTIRLAIANLAGVPSVVFGLFGLGVFVIFFNFGTSLLASAFTLAMMILPVIITASEEALRAVPQGFREGSFALGATKWPTVRRSVLPYALPGMLTGSILSVSRVAGETAPVLLTGAALSAAMPESVFDQIMILPYHLFILATNMYPPQVYVPLAYSTALVLLLVVLGLNGVAIAIRYVVRRKHSF